MPSVSFSNVNFQLPDAVPVLTSINLALGPGRFGLTGPNGGGKTTLLRLIAGLLEPNSGTVTVQGEVRYLPQRLGPWRKTTDRGTTPGLPAASWLATRSPDRVRTDGRPPSSGLLAVDPVAPVAELLGVAPVIAALRRIEAGSTAADDFTTVGTDWDIEDRVAAQLGRLGLDQISLDRPASSLSGGEAVTIAFASLLLRRPGIMLLDEPTNNLDTRSVRRLMDGIGQFKGVLLVVTHDTALLDQMGQIGELRGGQLAWYPAPFAAFEESKRLAREAATRRLGQAKAQVKAQQRDLAEAQTKQARRDAQGRAQASSMPKAVAHYFEGSAERTAAKSRAIHRDRLAEARQELTEARDSLEAPVRFRLELPETVVPGGRMVLELDQVRPAHTDLDVSLLVKGPERIGVRGPNGVGKTSLLRCAAGLAAPESGQVKLYLPARVLPQDLGLLDDSLTVQANMAPTDLSPAELRSSLARLGFRGGRVNQLAGTLSGGERWRATLAALLLRGEAPQLLILDEPTNNLDLDSRAFLRDALLAYGGALIVASHDEAFLGSIELTSDLVLGWRRLGAVRPTQSRGTISAKTARTML